MHMINVTMYLLRHMHTRGLQCTSIKFRQAVTAITLTPVQDKL